MRVKKYYMMNDCRACSCLWYIQTIVPRRVLCGLTQAIFF
jgi:hypothetical protein